MKFQFYTLFNIITSTTLFFVKAQNENIVNNGEFENLDTYYENELYSYVCTKSCKSVYERYQKCFNILDNEYTMAEYSEICKAYNENDCKTFLEDLYTNETVCFNGAGPDDFNVHDEITMNKIYYLITCSTDAQGQLCPYSSLVHNKTFNTTTIYHMKENVNGKVDESCSKRPCRENLRQALEYLVPLYEYDVKVDTDLYYESEFIENDKKALDILKSEACIAQDPEPIPIVNDTTTNIENSSDSINHMSILYALFIYIISILIV